MEYDECVKCRVQFERSTMQMITILKEGKYFKVLICPRCKRILDFKDNRRN